MKNVSYGDRAIIGVINISSTVNLEPELNAMAPRGVAILTARVPLPQTTPEELVKMAENAKDAAAQLASAKPDAIAFACTSGSFINGATYDRDVQLQLEAAAGGIPVVTTARALLVGLKTLGIRSFSIGTPYIDIVTQRAYRYFTDNGFSVKRVEGLGLDRDYLIGEQSEDTVRALAHRVDCPQSEAVVLSCTNLRSASLIEDLERELGKPVLTANQATLWYTLRTIGIEDTVAGFGTLMSQKSVKE